MSVDRPSWGDRVRYQVDRFLSWSPFSRFMGLFGLSFVLILICAVLAWLAQRGQPDKPFDFLEAMWWSLTRVADGGTMGGDTGTGVRAIAVFTTLCGVGVVALLIGLVSSTIGEKIDDLRKGKSPVIDEHHTLILGYGEKVFAILRELREANSNQPHASVVILSETDKEEVETQVRERLGDMRTTRVVVRQGSPYLVHDLRKVGAGRAKSLIVLARDIDEGDDGEVQDPDMGAIKTLLALRRIDGALTRNHAVVELIDSSRRTVVERLGAGGVEVVSMEETLSRMMVQTARQNGLAQVYRDLLTYEGSELYFHRFPELAGTAFGDAQWKMRDAVVIGYRRLAKTGADGSVTPAQTVLNPKDEVVLEADDELLVIAEDDDSFGLGANHQPNVAVGFDGAKPMPRAPERVLICGNSPKLADMLREYDHYVKPGSEAWLMPGVDKESFTAGIKQVGGLKNLKLKYVDGDPTHPNDLAKVASPEFVCALVVADTARDDEEADAATVITVLLLRDLFAAFGEKKPRIISEILNPQTKDLLEQGYGADFVVSSEMTSMLLAQVSERRELNAVFADLFDSDGNEIYLKRAACFAPLDVPTAWLAIQKMARRRGEVAIGYLRPTALPTINPKQDVVLTLTADDRIIVVSEDDRESADDSAAELPPPAPQMPAAPAIAVPPPPPRESGLVPKTGPRPPESKTVTAGPRVSGPSTQPKSPLPPKPKA